MSRSFLTLAIPSPLRRSFDYILPAGQAGQARPGVRVRVTFGKQSVIATLLTISSQSDVPADKLKVAEEILDTEPALPDSLHQLCLWAASYYEHPIGEVFQQALPTLLRQGEPLLAPAIPIWCQTALGRETPVEAMNKAPRQQNALSILRSEPMGISLEMAKVLGCERRDLKALADKGLAEELFTEATASGFTAQLAEPHLHANPMQTLALNAIRSAKDFHCFLLEGITGSGKTEVYLQAIESVLKAGQQALVLVPEISLTPQTVNRFRRRFLCPIVMLHSGLTDRERLNAWRQARSGQAGIIIGTRSAIFTPMKHPGIIIIDEEHDLSLKQQEGFRYHARDLAVMRAHLENIPIVLGSATPSLESLHNARTGRYTHLRLTQRNNSAGLPKLQILDIRSQRLTEGMSPPLLDAIRTHLRAGNQALVFVNRRGYAPVLMCHDCAWRMPCPRCDGNPVLHRDPPAIVCHHCGKEQPIPRRCQQCGSTDLLPVGVGTERLEQALLEHFSDYPVWRIDRDSLRRRQAMEQIFQEIHQGEPGILLGTQMLAKGHHFPAVTLVAIIDVDGGLFSADFRAPERTAQLIMQVAGRAGRGEVAGEVWLQSHSPDHPVLERLSVAGYEGYYETALTEREQHGLPPYGYLALLHSEANQSTRNQAFLHLAANQLQQYADSLTIWGPVPAPMERKAGRFRAHLLIQSTSRRRLHEALKSVLPALEMHPESKRVRWWLDVDPQELG